MGLIAVLLLALQENVVVFCFVVEKLYNGCFNIIEVYKTEYG